MVRLTLRAVLEDAGCEVILAPGGRAGLALASEHAPDLIITDIMMPEMDGLEVIRSVRSTTKAPPLVAMSGGGRIDDRDILTQALSLGAVAILCKPFDPEDVVSIIQTWVERNKPSNADSEP